MYNQYKYIEHIEYLIFDIFSLQEEKDSPKLLIDHHVIDLSVD